MSDQIEAIGAVELPKYEQVREAINVVRSWLSLAQELDDAFGIVLCAKTFGNRRGFTVRAMNEADRMGGKHDLTPPPFILCAAATESKPPAVESKPDSLLSPEVTFMRAAVVNVPGQAPKCQSFADPIAEEGEALVRVRAAGLHPIVKSLASGSHYASAGAGQGPTIPGPSV